jgi:parallel beta-helix repeat protein
MHDFFALYLSTFSIAQRVNEIYFYTNSSLYYTISEEQLGAHLLQYYPERLNYFNIHITRYSDPLNQIHSGESSGSYAEKQFFITWNKNDVNTTNPDFPYALSGHFAHELGHNLNLNHTYAFSQTCPTHFDYLSDIFGDPPGLICPTGTCPNNSCHHVLSWDCPNYICANGTSNNIMGGTQLNCYFSPKQIARAHRALGFDRIRQYVKAEDFVNNQPIEINSSQTWDFSLYLYNDLIIKSGNTLTITCEIAFSPGRKIVVEPNAKLIVDGGVLTATNNKVNRQLWRGIEVWGNKQERQLAQYQGVVELKNGALIENAEMAITTIRHTGNPYPYHVDWNTTGGIIKATDATFRNNVKDVQFMAYKNMLNGNEVTNMSFFKKCTFETTYMAIFANNWSLKETQGYINLYRVNGVKIEGCTFQNLTTNDYLATGIYSIEASYSVAPACLSTSFPCTSFQKNEFKNLNRGIRSFGSWNLQFPISIREAEFENNFGAIYLAGVEFVNVLQNEIVIREEPISSSYTSAPYGIYLDNCMNYRVEENSVTSQYISSPYISSASVGIILNNTAIDDEEIYNNYIEAVTVGIEAIGENRSGSGFNGLEMRCNDFINTRHDIYVVNNPQNPSNNPGVRQNQGSGAFLINSDLAGNTFSHDNNDNNFLLEDFYHDVLPTIYYHHHKEEPQTSFVIPGYEDSADKSTNVVNTEYANLLYTKLSSCPSLIRNPNMELTEETSIASFDYQMEVKMADALLHKAMYEYTLGQLIDGGNTPLLESEVDQLTFLNAWQLYAELISLSPYVSEEILVQLIERELDFPEAMLRDILVLNAHALGNNEVWHELDDRFSQLPEYMMEQIMAAAESGLTGADVIRMYISHYNKQYQIALQQRLYYRLTDTTEYFALDSAFALLYTAEGPRALTLMCQLLLSSGNYDWQEAYETKFNNFNFNADDTFQNELEEWYLWNIENTQNDESYFEMDSSTAEVVQDWIYYSAAIGGKAMGILSLRGELEYEEPVLIPLDLEYKTGSNKKPVKYTTMSLQPNPARDYTSIYYRTDRIKEQKEILITDLRGKILLRKDVRLSEDNVALILTEVPNGTYIISLLANGVIVSSEKLIIQK